jgi:hypothetical protein
MFIGPLPLKAMLPEGAGLHVGWVGSPTSRAVHRMRARVASRSGGDWWGGLGLLLAAGAHRAMMFLMVVLTTEGAADCLGPTDLEGMAPVPAPRAQGGSGDGLAFDYATGVLAKLNCPPDQFFNCRTHLGVPHFEIYGLRVRRG